MIGRAGWSWALVALAALAPSGGVMAQAEAEPATTAVAPAASAAGDSDDRAATEYLRLCSGCHTVGGGALTGPDLLTATTWAPADRHVAVERMEKNVGPMGPEQIDRLVDLLGDPNVQQRLEDAKSRRRQAMAATLEPPSPTRGRALFLGDAAFANGGLPCSACHRFGDAGGSLAVELTGAGERLGPAGLASAAENPSWPAMRAAYRGRPVTAQEAADLVAFLTGAETPAAAAPPVGPLGLALAALALAATVFLGRRRNRGVRAELVRTANRR